MKQITIKDLAQLCESEIKNGNADKLVLVSNDNGIYHGLNKGFSTLNENDELDIYNSKNSNPKNLIILE